MKNISFIIILILNFFFSSCSRNHTYDGSYLYNNRPALIIGIVADQMDYDYIERYWGKYSENGIKKMISKGFVCKNTYFEHFPTYTGPGHACIYTGTDPRYHGIVGNDWFDRNLGKTVYCTYDSTENTVGSFSAEGKMSPRNLLVTTITDRLKITSNFHSRVMGISLKDRAAILPAGHMADAAYWYDQSSKSWITSTYYEKNLPSWIEEFNKKDLPDEYMSKDWNTMLPIEEYTESTPDDNNYEKKYAGEDKPVFPHKLSELKYRNANILQYSPYGNSITKDFAIKTIENEKLGKGSYTDFLCINFASIDYVGHMFGPNSIEMEDTYLRFDKDIAELIEFTDKYLGNENVLYFMTADHGNTPNPQFLKDHKLDAGAFHNEIIRDSSNLYLKKEFGIENAVLSVINQQVYLNHELIYSQNKSLNITIDSLTAFLTRTFSGIKNIYSSAKLSGESSGDKFAKIFLNGYCEKRCGDIYINFRPYFIEGTLTGTEHGSPYSYDTHVPLIWFGWKIKAGETGNYYSTKSISATIAYILNIDVGETAENKPIIELIKRVDN